MAGLQDEHFWDTTRTPWKDYENEQQFVGPNAKAAEAAARAGKMKSAKNVGTYGRIELSKW